MFWKGGPEHLGPPPTSPTDPPGVGMVYPLHGSLRTSTPRLLEVPDIIPPPQLRLGTPNFITAPPHLQKNSHPLCSRESALRTPTPINPCSAWSMKPATRAQGPAGNCSLLSLTGAGGPKVGRVARPPGVAQSSSWARVEQDEARAELFLTATALRSGPSHHLVLGDSSSPLSTLQPPWLTTSCCLRCHPDKVQDKAGESDSCRSQSPGLLHLPRHLSICEP